MWFSGNRFNWFKKFRKRRAREKRGSVIAVEVSYIQLASEQGCLVRNWRLFSVPKVSLSQVMGSSEPLILPAQASSPTATQTWTWSTKEKETCLHQEIPLELCFTSSHGFILSFVTKSTKCVGFVFFFFLLFGEGVLGMKRHFVTGHRRRLTSLHKGHAMSLAWACGWSGSRLSLIYIYYVQD